MDFGESAAIKEGDGEGVGLFGKFRDILIEIDARVINCNPLSLTSANNSMA